MTEAQKIRRRETDRAWYWANREKNISDSKKWAAANPEKVKEARAARAAALRAIRVQKKAVELEWRAANPEAAAAYDAERRNAELAKKRAYDKTYRELHPERRRESLRKAGRKWRESNMDEAQKRGREYHKKIRELFPEKSVAAARAHKMKKLGLSAERYAQMISDQQSSCAVCSKPFSDKVPNIDHDHTTGQVRGLLCNACNSMLGFSKDSETTLFAAVDYLRRSNFKIAP